MHKKDYRDFLRDDLFLYWRVDPTKELDSFWEEFLVRNEDLKAPFNQAIEAFEEIRKTEGGFPNDHELLTNIRLRLSTQEKRKNKKLIFNPSIAAVLLVLIASTLVLIYNKPKATDDTKSATGEMINTNSVHLITGDEVLEIDNNSTLNLAEKKQSAVIRNPFSQKEVNLNDKQINKLVVPYGKRSTLILADGSTIHLNSGTKMEFPSTFSKNKREINVEGEIFIQVVNQPDAPFVIHTPHSQVTVHGTSFNVSSYIEDMHESIVLVNGSVEVRSQSSTIMLEPNEMAEIGEGQISKKRVDVSDYTSWVDGYMQLSNTPLNEVLKKIGRYYNVQFQYDPTLDIYEQTCSGKLFLSDELDDVMEAFSKMIFLKYEHQNDDTIFIHH